MRYTSLELVGFKRFGLNNIERFSIVMTEPTQLILGTNGSGKSSLMGELTPLPADPAAYTKEGSKTITITHEGRHYKLRSVFSPSPKHSFECDGEPLNEGGTAKAQLELVWQHFKMTPIIHRLLLGKDVREKFCTMAPMKRREWLTRLSDINYDYALGVYKDLQTRLRDTTGALKLARKNFVTETAKVITAAEEEKLRAEVAALSQELNVLLAERAPIRRSQQSIDQEIAQGLEELQRMSMRLLRTRYVAPYGHHPNQLEIRNDWGELWRPGFNSIAQLTAVIDEYRDLASARQALLTRSIEEHGRIKETVQILQRTGEEGIKSQTERLRALQEERQTLLDKLRLGLITEDPVNALSALDSVEELLQNVFLKIPGNEDRRYSTVKLQETESLLLQTQDRKRVKDQEFAILDGRRLHAETHRKTGHLTCPNCQHQWIAGYSDEKFAELLEAIAATEQARAAIAAEIVDLQDTAAKIREYGEDFRDYVRTVRNWPVLQALWDHIADKSYVQNAPRMVLQVLSQYRADLVLEVEVHQIEARQKEIEALIHQAAQLGDANLAEQTLKLEESTFHIEELTSKLTTAQAAVRDFTHYRNQLSEAEALVGEMAQLRKHLDTLVPASVEVLRLTTIEHCVKHLQHALVRKEETLTQVTLQKAVIAELERQIAQLTQEEHATRLLVTALSPTDGLIAEGLLGFIRTFTAQMNTLIRKVWTYPLVIQDCGTADESGAELDYKFPLMVQTKSNVVGDIGDGSEGMQEIINIAFNVVAMRYLGLAESPLMIDEFARAMDAAHKAAATNMVKNLIEQQPFTQLFMISHDYHQYGAFHQLQTCVLDPNNVVVPDKYNEHVTMS